MLSKEPSTDTRAGGLLSMMNLAAFAKEHKEAYGRILDEISAREVTSFTPTLIR